MDGIYDIILQAFLGVQFAWYVFIAMYIFAAILGAAMNYYLMHRFMKQILVEKTTALTIQNLCKGGMDAIKEYTKPHEAFLKKMRMSKPIFPESLDPESVWEKMSGIITGYITETYDYLRKRDTVLKPEHIIECRYIIAAQSLEMLYLWAKHVEIAISKGCSQYENVTYNMLVSILMKQALATIDLIDTNNILLPIGDAVGPLAVLHLTKDLESENVNGLHVTTEKRDDKVILYITAGDLNTFNFIGDKVTKLLTSVFPEETMTGFTKCLLTLDAQRKLLSMDVGEICHHYGAAIGGIGLQKYRLEELILHGYVPRAITVAMGMRDAIGPMSDAVHKASYKLADAVTNFIKDTDYNVYVVVGIGNQEGLRVW